MSRQYSVSVKLGADDNASSVINALRHRVDALGRSGRNASGAMAALGRGGNNALSGAVAGSRGGLIGGTIGGAAGLAGGIVGTAAAAGLGLLASNAIQTGMQAEKLSLSMHNVFTSSEEAAKALKFANRMADQSPLSFQDVTKTLVSLKRAGLDPLGGSLKNLTDFNSSLGNGGEELEGITRALVQMSQKGKIQSEEMNQLAERQVDAWGLLSRATGKTIPQLHELTKQGALGKKSVELLIKQMGKEGAGGAAKAAQTLEGRLSTLGDTGSQLTGILIGTRDAQGDLITDMDGLVTGVGLYAQLKKGVEELTDALNKKELKDGLSAFGAGTASLGQDIASNPLPALTAVAGAGLLVASRGRIKAGAGKALAGAGSRIGQWGQKALGKGTALANGGGVMLNSTKDVWGRPMAQTVYNTKAGTLLGRLQGAGRGLMSTRLPGGLGTAGKMLAGGGRVLGKMGRFGGPLLGAAGLAMDGYDAVRGLQTGNKKRAGSGIGGLVGTGVGALIGSLGGPIGIAVGGAIGQWAGSSLGGIIGNAFSAKPATALGNAVVNAQNQRAPRKDFIELKVSFANGFPMVQGFEYRGDKKPTMTVTSSKVTPAMGPMRGKPA